METRVAVLLTCHNRRETTLACLQALHEASIPEGLKFEVFLVDDGSTDGTGESVRKQFPKIHIIRGNGNLFWNKGMRLAWETASNKKKYDFYLLLNDDTVLIKTGLTELFQCYEEVFSRDHKPAIITGACQSSEDSNEFTYGGKTKDGPVLPNGELQQCTYTNGNVLLVAKEIFNDLGNLSPNYTHAMGDLDYGLRAIEKGYQCYTTKSYIAYCPNNKGISAWCDPRTPLIKRWRLMHSPRGLNLKEYNTFRRKFWGCRWMIFALKAYLKVFFPKIVLKQTIK